MTQRCGVVAIVGAPNAGKSTLVNALVGQKVAIVSPKAQTTRAKLLGIAIEEEQQAQLLLVDTPGIFTPERRLDRAMVAAAWEGTEGADIVALVVDAKGGIGAKVTQVLESLASRRERKILILNKVDIADKPRLLSHAAKLNEAFQFDETYFISASTGDGLSELKTALAKAMPESPWHFPEDQVSDATDRMIAAEITREQLYLQLHAELPYAAAIETEKYSERADGSVEIHQQIMIERPTQRAIVLGKGGTRLKEIGSRARAELSKIMGVPVHLYLHVKVRPGWQEDRDVYREIGLDWVD